MRLYYFDVTRGNKIALQYLAQELGWRTTIRLVLRMKYQLWTDHPFKTLNHQKPPSKQEKLTQRQMAPLIILYLMLERMYSRTRALRIISELSQRVGIAFLKYNVPDIRAADYKNLSRQEMLARLKAITQRFFNAKAELKLDHEDNFLFTVNVCYFARYAKLLNLPELAPLFCASDKIYFDVYQPDIRLIRTVTLAEHDKPCDFYFKWRTNELAEQSGNEDTIRTVF